MWGLEILRKKSYWEYWGNKNRIQEWKGRLSNIPRSLGSSCSAEMSLVESTEFMFSCRLESDVIRNDWYPGGVVCNSECAHGTKWTLTGPTLFFVNLRTELNMRGRQKKVWNKNKYQTILKCLNLWMTTKHKLRHWCWHWVTAGSGATFGPHLMVLVYCPIVVV